MAICKIATYAEMKRIPVFECNEQFFAVQAFDNTIQYGTLYSKSSEGATVDSVDGYIVVRQTVAVLLSAVNKHVAVLLPDHVLYVSCGYRSLEIQNKRFTEEYEKCTCQDEAERFEQTHQKIASPDVAGHPTGGAVDLTIRNARTKEFLDMGCEIADFSSSLYPTFAPGLTTEQQKNRAILRYCMVDQGFFPYFGEWWHFACGDREWAVFYDRPHATYGQVLQENVLRIGK